MSLVEYVTVVENSQKNSPACSHGPALLFDRVGKRFFACSAFRDRKLCPLYVELDSRRKFKTWTDLRERFVPKEEHHDPPEVLNGSQFCSECCRIYSSISDACSHWELQPVSPAEAKRPSTYLAQLSNNKGHAQYHFHEDTSEFIVRLAAKFDKVLCLGTPSIFERLRSLGVNCHLADIDRRLEAFYPPRIFTWFNMSNGLAFRDDDCSALWRFVEGAEETEESSQSPEVNDCIAFKEHVVVEKSQSSEQNTTLSDHKASHLESKKRKLSGSIVPNTKKTRSGQSEVDQQTHHRINESRQSSCGDTGQHSSPTAEIESTSARSNQLITCNLNRDFIFEDSVTAPVENPDQDQNSERFGASLVIVDPPFGALLSPLATTLKKLTQHGKWNQILVFPYFNESQVKLHFPLLNMCDLAVQYRNQRKMKNDLSPIRIFTDIPLKKISLPEPVYKYCAECSRWVHSVNIHCVECGTCPSKNHAPTQHCFICQRCVKQTWDHCTKCERCHLSGQCGARRGGEQLETSHNCTSSKYKKQVRPSSNKKIKK